jgi:hypothetical protein
VRLIEMRVGPSWRPPAWSTTPGTPHLSAICRRGGAMSYEHGDEDQTLDRELWLRFRRAKTAGLDNHMAEALVILGMKRQVTWDESFGIDAVMALVLQDRGLTRVTDGPEGWGVVITEQGDKVLREDPAAWHEGPLG